jgi:hypothetical protein
MGIANAITKTHPGKGPAIEAAMDQARRETDLNATKDGIFS